MNMYKPELNLAIFGHADHGKSTIAGKLLSVINNYTPQSLEQLKEKGIILDNKKYNKYNYLFLKNRTSTTSPETGLPDDQSRTVFPQIGYIDIDEERSLTLVDTPGASRFLDNIIYGAFLADKALLIVEATGGFERGILNIIKILSAFNIQIVGVLISKMDKTNYSQAVYEDVKNQLVSNLNLDISIIPFIPVSALEDEGISHFMNCNWYYGETVINLLDRLTKEYKKEADLKDVYFTVEGSAEVFSPQGVGTVLNGILESGCITLNTQLVIEPISSLLDSNVIFNVKSVQYVKGVNQTKAREKLVEVFARSIVSISLSDLSFKDALNYVKRGAVLGTLNKKPSVANSFESEIMFFDPEKVYAGKEYIIFANSCYSRCVIEYISEKEIFNQNYLDKNEINHNIIQVLDSKPNILYHIKLSLKQPLCIENSLLDSKFSRFVLREHNKIIACGKCINIIN